METGQNGAVDVGVQVREDGDLGPAAAAEVGRQVGWIRRKHILEVELTRLSDRWDIWQEGRRGVKDAF